MAVLIVGWLHGRSVYSWQVKCPLFKLSLAFFSRFLQFWTTFFFSINNDFLLGHKRFSKTVPRLQFYIVFMGKSAWTWVVLTNVAEVSKPTTTKPRRDYNTIRYYENTENTAFSFPSLWDSQISFSMSISYELEIKHSKQFRASNTWKI
jgi:hypothetical protein